jgi:L-asparaginase
MQTIHLLSTGGTVEKIYSEQTGQVENMGTKIERYLKQLRLPDVKISAVSLMNIDSLEMTDEDRSEILSAVESRLRPGEPVVITHGTDTMVQTGLYLRRHLGQPPAPIILTGAMTPLGFEGSDGLQNLTESLLAARLLAPAIYVVMHNQVFPIEKVHKDRELSRFVWSE